MPGTGYGSQDFLRASEIDAACRAIDGAGPMVAWQRMRAGSRELASYRRRLPEVEVRLTGSPAGLMIGEHLAIRDGRRWRYRTAQGVLRLPVDFATYMRGRHRQAVRTNVGHARRAGLTAASYAVDDWRPGKADSRRAHITPGPIERWMVFDADGAVAGDSILSIDTGVALLHGMVAYRENARWLLHTAIVERLCGSCELLLTNSEDAYLMGAGAQHFQRLLGYDIARLRVRTMSWVRPDSPPEPAGLQWPCGVASWQGPPEPPAGA
jgi:hypothetical protein